MVNYQGSIQCLDRIFQYGIAIGISHGKVYIWSENMKTEVSVIDMASFEFKIFSYFITAFYQNNRNLYISTLAGDLIKYQLSTKTPCRYSSIINLNYKITALTVQDSNDKPIIMLGTSNGLILTIQLNAQKILDIWQLGQPVKAVKCC